jgi:ribosomal protein S18 acetylase RimI-like enzyme
VSHIFVSYSRPDQEFAFFLAAALKNAGVPTWIDQLEIVVGEVWRNKIEEALNTASTCIAVLSPHYVASEYCCKELARANELELPMLPLLLHAVERSRWPLALQGIQYQSFIAWRDPSAFAKAIAALLHAIRRDSHAPIGIPPSAETQYLNSLVADLESRRGVLQYLDLDTEGGRCFPVVDEWGFALLEYDAAEIGARLLPVSEIARHLKRFVLMSEPGGGKTTTLRRLGLEQARARLQGKDVPIPVFLALPQWPAGQSIEEFIHANCRFTPDPLTLVNSGQIALYLDGLNEMGASGGSRAKELAHWIHSAKGPPRVIVCCRTSDYDYFKLGNLSVLALQPLNRAAVERFVQRYLGAEAEKLLKQIREDSNADSLHRLASNPYLLSALIYLFQYSAAEQIPRNAGRLFNRLSRALWERERQRATPQWVPFEEVEPQLAKLAYDMVDLERGTAVDLDFVKSRLGEELVAPLVSAQILVSTGTIVGFFHQAILDYFAAILLSQMDLTKILSFPAYSRRHLSRSITKWDGPIAALLGIRASDEAFIHFVGAIDPYYLGIWYSTVDAIPQQQANTIFNVIVEALRHPDWKYRIAGLHAIGKFKEERAAKAATPLLKDPHWEVDGGGYEWKTIYAVRTAAAWALGQIGDPIAVPALIGAAEDPVNNWATPNLGHRNAAGDALRALRQINTPTSRTYIKEKISRDEYEYLGSHSFESYLRDHDRGLVRQMLKELCVEISLNLSELAIESFPANYLTSGRSLCWTLEVLHPVAFAAASNHGDSWMLDYVYVRPAMRRLGVGRQLFDAIITDVKRNRGSQLRVTVKSVDGVATHFFMALGFQRTMQQPLLLHFSIPES